jgi:DNA-binding GntR family transcriptional regulator
MTVDSVEGETTSALRGATAARAAEMIRDLILQRTLLPGEQVRQEDLAKKIGTSRGPIREALQMLAVDGLVRHERNRGYFVTRLTYSDMKQIYLVRDLLESEVLRSLPPAPPELVTQLREINEPMGAPDAELADVVWRNTQFHQVLMAPSPLNYLKELLGDMQRKYVAYQAISIHDRDVWKIVVRDHEAMIDALAAGDTEKLVDLAGHHREASLHRLASILG